MGGDEAPQLAGKCYRIHYKAEMVEARGEKDRLLARTRFQKGKGNLRRMVAASLVVDGIVGAGIGEGIVDSARDVVGVKSEFTGKERANMRNR